MKLVELVVRVGGMAFGTSVPSNESSGAVLQAFCSGLRGTAQRSKALGT